MLQMFSPHITYVIFLSSEIPIEKECTHLGRGMLASQEPPKHFLISYSYKTKLPYSVNFKLIKNLCRAKR